MSDPVLGTGPQDISSLLGAKPQSDQVRSSRMNALKNELQNPLFRNAYALMLNGGLTGVLGLAFWLAVEHLYEGNSDAGRSLAVIAAIMCIGGMTILNYMLMRFIPQAGRSTTRLVTTTYLVGAVAAGILAALFLISLSWWESENFDHLTTPVNATMFIVFVMAWNIFTQQDGVFTGLRRADWVPVKGTLYGIIKFALLFVLALSFSPGNGVLLATMIPVLLVVVPADILIFKRLIPEHVALTKGLHRTPTPREVGKYLSGDYVGTVFSHSAINFIPVLVAANVSSATNKQFAFAWIFGLMLDLLALNMAMSMTVEGAHSPAKLSETTRNALRRTVMLLLPVSLLFAFVAPYILGLDLLFGEDFRDTAGPVLTLLALATLPQAVIETYVGVLRVRTRTHFVALIQGARFIGVMTGVLLFVSDERLIAVGWSVIAVQTTIALCVLPALWKVVKPSQVPAQGGKS